MANKYSLPPPPMKKPIAGFDALSIQLKRAFAGVRAIRLGLNGASVGEFDRIMRRYFRKEKPKPKVVKKASRIVVVAPKKKHRITIAR